MAGSLMIAAVDCATKPSILNQPASWVDRPRISFGSLFVESRNDSRNEPLISAQARVGPAAERVLRRELLFVVVVDEEVHRRVELRAAGEPDQDQVAAEDAVRTGRILTQEARDLDHVRRLAVLDTVEVADVRRCRGRSPNAPAPMPRNVTAATESSSAPPCWTGTGPAPSGLTGAPRMASSPIRWLNTIARPVIGSFANA